MVPRVGSCTVRPGGSPAPLCSSSNSARSCVRIWGVGNPAHRCVHAKAPVSHAYLSRPHVLLVSYTHARASHLTSHARCSRANTCTAHFLHRRAREAAHTQWPTSRTLTLRAGAPLFLPRALTRAAYSAHPPLTSKAPAAGSAAPSTRAAAPRAQAPRRLFALHARAAYVLGKHPRNLQLGRDGEGHVAAQRDGFVLVDPHVLNWERCQLSSPALTHPQEPLRLCATAGARSRHGQTRGLGSDVPVPVPPTWTVYRELAVHEAAG